MKKLLATLLALLTLLSVFPPGLAAEEPLTFVIEAPETLPAVGEEFTVTVRAEHNPGFHVVQFYLVYPTDTMICKEMTLGEMIPPTFAAVNPKCDGTAALSALSTEPMTGDGVLAECVFVVDQPSAKPDFRLEEALFGDELAEVIDSEVELRLIGAETPPDKPAEPSKEPEPTKDPEPTQEPEPTKDPDPTEPPEPTQEPEPAEEYEPTEPPAPVPDFTDVKGHWGEDAILRSVEEGLFKGYPDNTFRPDEPVTRAQFVTVLWRLSGSPEEKRDVPFTDTAGQYAEFQSAIAWGYHRGYVKGTSDATFSPENTLTRQEALTILHRLSGSQVGMEAMFTGIYDSQFSDSEAIAPWAKAAMYWGVYRELIQGVGGGQLSPTGVAGRAQIAKIVLQYQTMMKKEGK